MRGQLDPQCRSLSIGTENTSDTSTHGLHSHRAYPCLNKLDHLKETVPNSLPMDPYEEKDHIHKVMLAESCPDACRKCYLEWSCVGFKADETMSMRPK